MLDWRKYSAGIDALQICLFSRSECSSSVNIMDPYDDDTWRIDLFTTRGKTRKTPSSTSNLVQRTPLDKRLMREAHP